MGNMCVMPKCDHPRIFHANFGNPGIVQIMLPSLWQTIFAGLGRQNKNVEKVIHVGDVCTICAIPGFTAQSWGLRVA